MTGVPESHVIDPDRETGLPDLDVSGFLVPFVGNEAALYGKDDQLVLFDVEGMGDGKQRRRARVAGRDRRGNREALP